MSAHYDITSAYLIKANYRVIHAGDDYTHTFTVRRAGVVLDLTNAKLWFTAKENATDADSEAVLAYDTDNVSEMEITDAVNGQFKLYLKHADTEDLAGTWDYDIQALLDSGDVITLARGVIEFLPNITRTYS